jgi:hypothetical protein
MAAAAALAGLLGCQEAGAAVDPHILALQTSAFPAGAFITHEHIDRTAAAVDAEGFVGSPSTQGQYYESLHFAGSIYQSARLPAFNAAGREVWLLATIFPSPIAASQALAADARFAQCDRSPTLAAMPAHTVTCAYTNASATESGMYVVSAIGRVEFIVLGFVKLASDTARERAVRDAAFLALREAARVRQRILQHLL